MNVRDEKDNNVERRSTDGKKNKMEEDFPSKPAGYVSVDRISGLPDDVLAIILSQLSFKQATQTSLLSTRWKSLWALFTGTLDFDASDRLRVMDILHMRILDVERKRFVNWVNKVLDLHKARSIDGMRICFDVDCKPDLDSWMSFAVKKRVRTLELNLSRFSFSPQLRESYNPPLHLLNYLGSSCVTTLHLVHVNVTGESLQHILSENSFLERLSVEYSPSLVSLKISGPSLKLKHLELRRCFQLKDLQLSSPNLLSIKYSGPVISNPFVNAPCLTEVSFGGLYCEFIIKNIFQFSSLFMQLEKLKLDIGSEFIFERFPQNIPELKNLKHLELVVRLPSSNHALLPFITLLRAAPSLCGFKVKFPIPEAVSNELKVIKEKQPFRCLKTVEILGFVGGATDMDLVLYLLENAVELEKLIIDTCETMFVGTLLESEHRGLEKFEAARQRAAELVTRVPPRAELVVL